jgi:hypothetical protein
VRVSEFDGYATPRPRGMDPHQDQYALIVDVDKALGFEAQLRPRPLRAESPQLLEPRITGRSGYTAVKSNSIFGAIRSAQVANNAPGVW